MNKLFYGDCLQIINSHLESDSIDLIYLDPPFNSNRSYNAIYKDNTGQPLPEQIEAFCDIWELNEARERAITNLPILMREAGVDDSAVELWKLWMVALRNTQPRLLAYLSYMAERLVIMKRVLKESGSVYLHCDPTASHYIKLLMDAIFGYNNFRNEIIWGYRTGGASKKRFSRKHDTILCYAKNDKVCKFNTLKERVYYEKPFFNTQKDEQGRYYADVIMTDTWTDIKPLINMSKERLGYPTQKPSALLKRIIIASTDEDDLVLDPFCGCATTIAAAHELGRRWVGIDIAYHAIKRVVQSRLYDKYQLIEGKHYLVDGIPGARESAIDLWERDKYQFQRWIVETIDGFVTTKETNDGGIDGRLYFKEVSKKELSSMIIEVKGGENVGIGVVRDLRGTMERSGAQMAGLIIRDSLGTIKKRNFDNEMLSAGLLDDGETPRMQILTLDEVLEGKKFRIPNIQGQSGKQSILTLDHT